MAGLGLRALAFMLVPSWSWLSPGRPHHHLCWSKWDAVILSRENPVGKRDQSDRAWENGWASWTLMFLGDLRRGSLETLKQINAKHLAVYLEKMTFRQKRNKNPNLVLLTGFVK